MSVGRSDNENVDCARERGDGPDLCVVECARVSRGMTLLAVGCGCQPCPRGCSFCTMIDKANKRRE